MPQSKPRFFKGIRLRLVLVFSGAMIITISIIASWFYILFNQKLDATSQEFTQNELLSTIHYIQEQEYSIHDSKKLLSEISKIISSHNYKLYFALYNQDGELITKSDLFTPDKTIIQQLQSLQQDERIYHSKSYQSHQKRDYLSATAAFTNTHGERFFLQFAFDTFHHLEVRQFFIDTVQISVPIYIFLVLFISILLTRWVLNPISKLTKVVRSFSLTTGTRLLPVSKNNDELDNLSQTLNTLVTQNRSSFQTLITFTANASHELRLPIAAIKGEAEICLSKDRSIPEYQSILESIIEELEKLTKMINRLLLLTRSDSGEVLQLETININDTLMHMCNFYQAYAQTKCIQLIYHPSASSSTIQGDVDKIQEIFSNLIENAIKYTHEGGEVNISFTETKTHISVSISDNGIGISDNHKQRIFERFYQADNARSKKTGGVGLGLSIVETLVEAHHGHITLESSLGQGSCFTVSFPKH